MSVDTYDEDLISLISMGIYECEWGIYDVGLLKTRVYTGKGINVRGEKTGKCMGINRRR